MINRYTNLRFTQQGLVHAVSTVTAIRPLQLPATASGTLSPQCTEMRRTFFTHSTEAYCSLFTSSQIPLRYLVADRSEAGRRPAASWNLAYHLAS